MTLTYEKKKLSYLKDANRTNIRSVTRLTLQNKGNYLNQLTSDLILDRKPSRHIGRTFWPCRFSCDFNYVWFYDSYFVNFQIIMFLFLSICQASKYTLIFSGQISLHIYQSLPRHFHLVKFERCLDSLDKWFEQRVHKTRSSWRQLVDFLHKASMELILNDLIL